MNASAQAAAVRRGPVRLDPVPLHELQPLGEGDWLASGNDPHFRVQLPPGCRQAGILRVTAELDGAHLERPCVYFDTGDGWTEAGCVELRPDGPGCWTAVVPMTALAEAVRFDPSQQAGRFRLGALRLEHLDPAVLLLELLAADSAANPGSAADVFAHAGRLARDEGSRTACEWLLSGGADRLREPPGSYTAWIRDHDTLPAGAAGGLRAAARAMPARPMLSLLLPLHGCHDRLRDCIASVQAQIYPDWELLLIGDAPASSLAFVRGAIAASSRIRFFEGPPADAAAWNHALDAARGAFIGVIEAAPVLAPHALLAMAEAVAAVPGAGMVYSDCDRIDAVGRRHSPSFRPAWNPDLFLSRDYVGGAMLIDAGLARAAGGFRNDHAPALLADLALRCIPDAGPPPLHLPLVLSHWPDGARHDPERMAAARRAALAERLGARVLAVEAAGDGARVRWPLPDPAPRVSIVVPTRDRVELLRQCVESILARSTYPDIELLVVDNGSVEPPTLDYLAGLESRPRVRVLRYERPFNYSAINNFAVGEATGEVVALVNNDIEVLTPGWLEEMVAHALRPGVGAVGAMLYYPDDTIQHAGVVVGLGGVAGHVYSRQPRGSTGEEGRAALAQDLSAVTAACLVVRMSAWRDVGGLDEALGVAFNDVDFCLRLRRAGYRNLWTPHAEFYHHESASRGSEDTEEKLRRFHSEVAFMVERWGEQLEDDPAYSPNLSLRHGAANELASPPRRGLRHWLDHMGVAPDAPPEEKGRWNPR